MLPIANPYSYGSNPRPSKGPKKTPLCPYCSPRKLFLTFLVLITCGSYWLHERYLPAGNNMRGADVSDPLREALEAEPHVEAKDAVVKAGDEAKAERDRLQAEKAIEKTLKDIEDLSEKIEARKPAAAVAEAAAAEAAAEAAGDAAAAAAAEVAADVAAAAAAAAKAAEAAEAAAVAASAAADKEKHKDEPNLAPVPPKGAQDSIGKDPIDTSVADVKTHSSPKEEDVKTHSSRKVPKVPGSPGIPGNQSQPIVEVDKTSIKGIGGGGSGGNEGSGSGPNGGMEHNHNELPPGAGVLPVPVPAVPVPVIPVPVPVSDKRVPWLPVVPTTTVPKVKSTVKPVGQGQEQEKGQEQEGKGQEGEKEQEQKGKGEKEQEQKEKGEKGEKKGKVNYCEGQEDPFRQPVDTFIPPKEASFEAALEWKNAVKNMVSKVSKVKVGGDSLRALIKEEVTTLQIMRFKMSCMYA